MYNIIYLFYHLSCLSCTNFLKVHQGHAEGRDKSYTKVWRWDGFLKLLCFLLAQQLSSWLLRETGSEDRPLRKKKEIYPSKD